MDRDTAIEIIGHWKTFDAHYQRYGFEAGERERIREMIVSAALTPSGFRFAAMP